MVNNGQLVQSDRLTAATGNTLTKGLVVDSLPTYDPHAEAGALGCVLTGNNGQAELFLRKLTLDHFYDHRHQTVLRAMKCVVQDGKQPDVLNVRQWLIDKHEDADSQSYVMGLPESVQGGNSPENFPSFLETLEDRMKRRRVLTDSSELAMLARDTSKPMSVLADAAHRMAEAHARAAQGQDISRLLQERAFDGNIEPPALRPVFTLAGTQISTPANLTTITSDIKTGKSAAIAAMVASVMPHTHDADLLGFRSSNEKGLALLWFDSEQSPDDFWHCVRRSMKRAGCDLPPWVHPYCLTGLDSRRAWECVLEATRIAADQHGGVHSIQIDGVADLVSDVNDAGESNAFVARLHDLAIKYDCAIVGVIHFNPGTEKSRGHLGSQLERKAETNLTLEKDKDDESTVIYSTKNRRAGIPKNSGPRFKFNPDVGMHVTIESRQSAKDAADREDLLETAQDVFGDRPSMRYLELTTVLKQMSEMSDRTAKRKIAKMTELGVIQKSVVGLYTLGS